MSIPLKAETTKLGKWGILETETPHEFSNFKSALLVAICQEADLKSHYLVEIEHIISEYSFDYEDWFWFEHAIGSLKDADLLIEHDRIPQVPPIIGRVMPTPAGFREAAALSAAGVVPAVKDA